MSTPAASTLGAAAATPKKGAGDEEAEKQKRIEEIRARIRSLPDDYDFYAAAREREKKEDE